MTDGETAETKHILTFTYETHFWTFRKTDDLETTFHAIRYVSVER